MTEERRKEIEEHLGLLLEPGEISNEDNYPNDDENIEGNIIIDYNLMGEH